MSAEAAGVAGAVVASLLRADERHLAAVTPHVQLQQSLGGRGVVADPAAELADLTTHGTTGTVTHHSTHQAPVMWAKCTMTVNTTGYWARNDREVEKS